MNAREALLDECICRFERMQAQYDQCTLDIRNMTGQLNGHREQLEAYLSKTAAMLSRTQSDSMRDVSFTSSSSDSTSPSASSSSSSSSSASSSPVYRHQDLDKHVEQIKASLHQAEKKIRQIQIEANQLKEANHPNSNILIQK